MTAARKQPATRPARSPIPPLVEPMPLEEMIRRYGDAKPPVRLDTHGQRVCLSCPRPLTSTSPNARFCERCGKRREGLIRNLHIADARPKNMMVPTAVLDELVRRNAALQSAILEAVSEFREARVVGDDLAPRWVNQLSDAAKGVEHVIRKDIQKVVRTADQIAKSRATTRGTVGDGT